MFAYLKGILTEARPSHIILEVNGVGYSVLVPCRLLGELPALGQNILIYTTFVVREASHTLYGFLTSRERDVFEVLMNVTGIGPKLALSLIGHLSLSNLHDAIVRPDLPTLCRVPGVGKKTAERMIVELKDKLADLLQIDAASHALSMSDPKLQHAQDAILALINLGYHQNVAQKAIKQTLKEQPEITDLALLITTALKNV